jgi:hypothetical protein
MWTYDVIDVDADDTDETGSGEWDEYVSELREALDAWWDSSPTAAHVLHYCEYD